VSSSTTRADYESLSQIARSFGQQADATRQSLQRLRSKMGVLQGGDWEGKGADKFYQEMDSAVLPAVQRLAQALERASETTRQISRVMKQAEDDAARLFRLEDAGRSRAPFTINNMVMSAVLGATGDASPDAGAGGAGSGPRPLLASNYKTLDDLKKDVAIEYGDGYVMVRHGGRENYLKMSTFTQKEVTEARDAWDKGDKSKAGKLLGKNLSLAWDLKDNEDAMHGIFTLGQKNPEGVTLNTVAKAMLGNLKGNASKSAGEQEALKSMFLHVHGQALITSLWGSQVADISGDIHERDQEALITGKFEGMSSQQMNGVIDNYVDLVNNMYGQDLGERLKDQFKITKETKWTDQLTADYFTAVQDYLGETHGLTFKNFDTNSKEVKAFTRLLNGLNTK